MNFVHYSEVQSTHGEAVEVISDQGPHDQFTSEQFNKFCTLYEIKHSMSSPHYHQANGMAEAQAKQAKRILKFAKIPGRDPHLGVRNVKLDESFGHKRFKTIRNSYTFWLYFVNAPNEI